MNGKEASYKSSERGQALIIVALFLLGLLAMLGLVLDGGNLYLQRRRMQNAADAGALAGAHVLAHSGSAAETYAAALDYARQRNGADSCEISIDDPTITVVAQKDTEMTFAQMVGVTQVDVRAIAEAKYAPIGAVRGLAPIAIISFPYEYDTPYTIWDDDTVEPPDPESGDIAGNMRGWLSFDCVFPDECGDAGASLLTEWMLNGYPGMRSSKLWYRGSSGIKTKPVAITQTRVGEILYIPVYDDIVDMYPGKPYYHVVRFAAFEVTAVYATSNPKGIEGVFKEYVAAGPPDDGGPDGGLRTIYLIK